MHPLFESIDLIHDPEPHPAALNMAVDEILLQHLSRPVLRVYRWLRPSVSFGYFEKFKAVQAQYPSREPVRRWTGGGVVPHGEDLTYSLLVPTGSLFLRLKTAESYRAIHERIAAAMNRAGVTVSMAGDDQQKISQACFENPTRYDILREGRKIAGAAQRRTKFGLLHQGSIQNIDLPLAFGESLAAEFSGQQNEREIGMDELAAAQGLAESKYATEAWTRKF
ncbi:MAG: hypothetical protein WCH43_01090 [Verrucomicrobiota bacterium]